MGIAIIEGNQKLFMEDCMNYLTYGEYLKKRGTSIRAHSPRLHKKWRAWVQNGHVLHAEAQKWAIAQNIFDALDKVNTRKLYMDMEPSGIAIGFFCFPCGERKIRLVF